MFQISDSYVKSQNKKVKENAAIVAIDMALLAISGSVINSCTFFDAVLKAIIGGFVLLVFGYNAASSIDKIVGIEKITDKYKKEKIESINKEIQCYSEQQKVDGYFNYMEGLEKISEAYEVPDRIVTKQFFDKLREDGVTEEFIIDLQEEALVDYNDGI